MRLVESGFVKEARVFPLKHPRAKVASYRVIGLVAQYRRRQQQGHDDVVIHQAHAAHGAHYKQQRIAGQKRHDDQASFDKDDQKQQRIHPQAVVADKHFQVTVNV